ncbi:MAG: ATP-binding protein [Micrococcales bacterium]|nr:ATP-binding protein [Micrococcales bacterium]
MAVVLLSFGVENFKAFRDAQELSLRRVRALVPTWDATNSEDPWDREISTVIAVYGANASGKSTLVQAVNYLVSAVEDSYVRWAVAGGTEVEPFALDPATAGQPSSFELEVRGSDGADYQYGFTVDDQRVVREWLYVYQTARRTVLFTREGAELTFGPTFRGARVALTEAAATRPNALTLSVGAQLGNRVIAAAYQAVLSVRVYQASTYPVGTPAAVHLLAEHPEDKTQFLQLLRNADIGVSDVSVHHTSAVEQAELHAQLADHGIALSTAERIVRDQSRRLQLTHTCAGGGMRLPFDTESDGTQALVSFGPVILRGLAQGHTVVIDEVDTSLHPLVVRAVVALFADRATNPHQAQLVFTTHDTSLLGRTIDSDPIARDQFWLTQKDPATGAAELVAVAEYSPRKSESLERGYLTGRYGGIPHLRVPLLAAG